MHDSIRRKVLAYALFRANFSESIDPIAALRPFLVPIANELAGQPFDAEIFRSEMRARYDLRLSRDVADLFSQRLAQLHYVQRVNDGRHTVWRKQSDQPNGEGSSEASSMDHLIEAAKQFYSSKRDLGSAEFDEDAFLQGLLAVLLDSNPASSAANAVKNIAEGGDNNTPSVRLRNPDQYLASEFINWARQYDQISFDWVTELSGAAMVAEALVEIRTPSRSGNITTDLTVYLDAPFLMELLGVSGTAALEDALEITTRLRNHNIQIAVLSHSVEEAEHNLKAVLHTDTHRRTGPTAMAIISGEVREEDVREIHANIEHYIESLKVRIVKPSDVTHLIDGNHFSEVDEHNFFAAIQSHYRFMEAAERDAASVAWIIRRRKGFETKDVLKSKHIFVTRNKLLYRTMNRFASDRGAVTTSMVGPIILARDLAGVMWIIEGEPVEKATPLKLPAGKSKCP